MSFLQGQVKMAHCEGAVLPRLDPDGTALQPAGQRGGLGPLRIDVESHDMHGVRQGDRRDEHGLSDYEPVGHVEDSATVPSPARRFFLPDGDDAIEVVIVFIVKWVGRATVQKRRGPDDG